jgi:hypothetical protein
MSIRVERLEGLKGIDYNSKDAEELGLLFQDVLGNGLHGLCYSAYDEGQKPGTILTKDQIRRRMAIIAPHIKWIRSFSCVEGNELVAEVARELGLKTLVGAWLSDDKELNEQEIEGLIRMAKAGVVDIAAEAMKSCTAKSRRKRNCWSTSRGSGKHCLPISPLAMWMHTTSSVRDPKSRKLAM